jgi:hypothetical protein
LDWGSRARGSECLGDVVNERGHSTDPPFGVILGAIMHNELEPTGRLSYALA